MPKSKANAIARKQPPQHQSKQPGEETKMFPQPVVIRDDYVGSGKLLGQIALISGGDSGIGRSVAVHFAREGANVAIVYLDEDRDAGDTAAMVEAEGAESLLLRGDVRSRDFCREAVKKTVARFGMLDILVNNAAEQHARERVQEISEDQLESTFRTNMFGYIFMTQAALENMSDRGCIINTGSVTGFRGSDHLLDYAATKGAIRAFTYSLAKQVVERGIRVNGVAPGPVWTPLIPASFSAEEVARFGTDTPMKRAAQPCEVGPAYVFLASNDASYMTGQFIHINGGGYMS
jgi:NAD(P)-dependent dehydrogenase (short-subunit alcohol dehydrogenase family)